MLDYLLFLPLHPTPKHSKDTCILNMASAILLTASEKLRRYLNLCYSPALLERAGSYIAASLCKTRELFMLVLARQGPSYCQERYHLFVTINY